MDPMDESLKKQIATLLRVIHVTRCSKEDNVPCQIEEGLFLGSIGAANNKDELKNLNITHILTVANSLAPAYPNDFVYKVINVPDRVCTDLKQHFDECINYIDEATRSGGGVLVHCFVGRSRSVTIIVAYLMKKHGMSISQALEHVKSRRPQASPNAGFISQLESFERSLCGGLILTTPKERFEGNASQKVEVSSIFQSPPFHSSMAVHQDPIPSLVNTADEENKTT
ncbi:hypothetical protein EV1_012484 [Malus domestica]